VQEGCKRALGACCRQRFVYMRCLHWKRSCSLSASLLGPVDRCHQRSTSARYCNADTVRMITPCFTIDVRVLNPEVEGPFPGTGR
jgi:hypothetical protein